MKNIFLVLIATCFFFEVNAQTPVCGISAISVEQYNKLKLSAQTSQNFAEQRVPGVLRNVALNINILVYTNGPITTAEDVQIQVDSANYYFANAGIEFTICNVNFVPYTHNWIGWDVNYEYQIAQVYDLPGCLNIYYVDFIPNASAYAYYAMQHSPDRIIMGQHLSGEIFAHELGHSFNLIHTHGDFFTPLGTLELVNGSNCAQVGDLICDTPADPNLYVNRVDSLCNYTDTVSTDSLGSLFNPDTRNIMSYTPFHCYEHFTQGQYNRIAYTMAHERAYLKSGEHVTATVNAPSTICIYDAPVTLTANPSGGTFSGNGVSGNQFDPAVAGPGIHIIAYSVGTASNPESTDQYYQYYDTTYSTTTAWQSFTSAASENLLAFSFNIKSSVTQDVIVTLYDSIGTAGNVLANDTIALNADSLFNWNRFTFSSPVHLNAGTQYTVQITTVNTIEITGNRNNVYPSGSTSATNDLSFITHVQMDAPFCGNGAYHAVYVSAPPTPVITNLLPLYCINAPAQPINASPGGGTATIAGNNITTIDPGVLGSGQHDLYYIYIDAYGCSNDSTFAFNVNDTTSIVPILPSILCSNHGIYSLSGLPAGGIFYFDNQLMVNPAFNTDTLSGTHTVSYTYDALYPWIDSVDQDNYFNSSNSTYSLSFGQDLWQSFTAGQDGYLYQIDFGMYVADTTLCTYKIYKGEGVSGSILYANTITITDNSTYNHSFPVPPFQLFIDEDSMYTFQLEISPWVTNMQMYDDSVYTRGNCHLAFLGLPETDFSFRTHINTVYQCGQDSLVSQFTISAAPIVELGNDTTLTAGQMLMLNAGNPGCTYQWSTGANSQTIFVAGNSTVIVTVTNSDGCSATDSIHITVITAIEEHAGSFNIMPNPVTDQFKITTDKSIQEILLINALGQPVAQINNISKSNNAVIVDTRTLKEGIYMLKVLIDDKWDIRKVLKSDMD